MTSESKIRDPAQVDKIISAEIPDQNVNAKLYEVITTFNLHGPCGKLRPNAPCNKSGSDDCKCSKGYPHTYNNEGTNIDPKLHYPQYLRRDELHGGRTVQKYVSGKQITMDNRWVVPFNPVLSEVFEAHINVEVVMSLGAVKYLYKYITKGSDKILFSIRDPNVVDEVEMFEVGRFVSATEAFWRIYQFKINTKHPNVKKLPIHLPKQQLVYFDPDNIDESLADEEPKTELMAFFELNQSDPDARQFLYPDIVKHYTWQSKDRRWQRRKLNLTKSDSPSDTIGRIPIINLNPKQEELYYLRICLHHVTGPKSFEDLRTVNGIVYETYKDACVALGMLEDDKELSKALERAESITFGRDLRELFGTILTHGNPLNAAALWDEHKEQLVQDYIRQNGGTRDIEDNDDNRAKFEIQLMLDSFGLDLHRNFGIPYDSTLRGDTFTESTNSVYDIPTLKNIASDNLEKLTTEQKEAFKLITQSIEKNDGKCYALDAPGGTGKTFLITTLLATVRANNQVAIATATSGIAATLLDCGRTLHSALKVPLDIDEASTCNISPRDKLANQLRQCKLLVIDEVTMAHKHIYEAIDRTLRDITGKNAIFGGITVLLSGDWRQILPVVHRGGRVEIVDACLKQSYIWKSVKQLKLTQNLRLTENNPENAEFAAYLLSIGNGTVGNFNDAVGAVDIEIPDNLRLQDNTMKGLCDYVFGEGLWHDATWLCSRAILAPTNELADKINYFLMDWLPGALHEFNSADTIIEGSENFNQFPPEYINTLTLPGLPPHKLSLKVGCPIMLLRNLDPRNGHCNGSRYVVNQIHQHLIDATVAYGPNVGRRKLIPRIATTSKDKLFPFPIKRIQFPIRPSFAMTVNKSQGQSFNRVGIFLKNEIFCHGQLYVALSRVRDVHSLKIATDETRQGVMKNIVYREVL